MRRLPVVLSLVALASGLAALPRPLVSRVDAAADFAHFESAQVHPLALTPDGTRLLAVNTPDDRLTVFDVTGPAPVRVAEIAVGLEPVSVAARTNTEAWVVNQLSDDVSVVDLTTFNVRATIPVGDEPADVVFAGSPQRAWVSVSQEDAIKVYDPANLAAAPAVIAVPARTPRALAVNAAGTRVDCAIFDSNHRETVLSSAEAGDSLPAPDPPMNPALPPAPKTGLIVQFDGAHWVDVSGRTWDSKVPYTLNLVELMEFDAATLANTRTTGDIATSNLCDAVSPVDGTAAVTGTYARTEVRFEPNLRGHLTEARLGLWPASGASSTVQLNPHIDYSVSPGPASESDSSLGIPSGVAWSPDGRRVYVTSLASDKLGVLDAAGAIHARVSTVAGPTGVLADPARPRLYVLGRFHDQLQVLSTADFSTLAVARVGFDPTPDDIVNGRRLFYGGSTSGHGDEACASCHLFGDMDDMAWDLGNPLGDYAPPPPNQTDPLLVGYHPMKGPMVTQSLRGLPNTVLLHWRGDRANFNAFDPAFVTLMGRGSALPDSEMNALAAFVMPLVYPPNPRQLLDRSFPDAPPGQPSAVRGRSFFLNTVVDGPFKCVTCHALPTGTNGQVIDSTALRAPQDMKVPQLRNLYKKSGFTDAAGVTDKRGVGYTHDGAIDNLFDFLKFPGFNFGTGATADNNRRDVEAFLLAFDTGMAPAVGAQVTFDGGTLDAGRVARMDTLVARADAADCDLVAKGRVGSTATGWKYVGSGLWQPDRQSAPAITSAALRALASAGHELTVTGVPPGSGTRLGLDRDRDGYWDGDELAAGSDPGDALSTPGNVSAGGAPPTPSGLRGARPNPFRAATEIEFSLARAQGVELAIYDVLGREVRTLARGTRFEAGPQRLAWDGRDDAGRPAGPGLYFARLRSPDGSWTRPLAKLR